MYVSKTHSFLFIFHFFKARGIKKIKTTRLTNVVPYFDGNETPESVQVVTEHVIPLYESKGDIHPSEILYGIYTMAVCPRLVDRCNLFNAVILSFQDLLLIFAKKQHCLLNFSPETIVVTSGRQWKIGCLEMLVDKSDYTSVTTLCSSEMNSRIKNLLPPEMQSESFGFTERELERVASWQIGLELSLSFPVWL